MTFNVKALEMVIGDCRFAMRIMSEVCKVLLSTNVVVADAI